jgi:hypothetical protein
VYKSLAFAQDKTRSSDSPLPIPPLSGTTPENDVVTVDPHGHPRTGDKKTEGEVVLETQQRETEEVSHQLPASLYNDATSRITYRRAE